MYKNKIYMTTIGYLLSINTENYIYLAWIYIELFLIEDIYHHRPGARQWHVCIAFH